MSEDDVKPSDQVTDIIDRHQGIVAAAVVSVMRHEPMRAIPEKVAGEMIVGYLHRIEKDGVSQRVAEAMLREDLEKIVEQMSEALVDIPDKTYARIAVVIHLALDMGFFEVMKMHAFWRAMSTGDWEAANDAMLKSQWPAFVGQDSVAIDRALAFSRMLRTGTMPPLASLAPK